MENTEGPTPARSAADAFQGGRDLISIQEAQEQLDQVREQHEEMNTPASAAAVRHMEARLAAIIERTET